MAPRKAPGPTSAELLLQLLATVERERDTAPEPAAPGPERAALSVNDAAAYLSISRHTLWTLTKMGAVPSVIIGARSRRYLRADLDAFLEQQRVAG